MKTANFYNAISRVYPIIDLFLKSHKNRLIKVVNDFPKAEILEIGVGQSNHLLKYKSRKITAIDSSIKMLKEAKKKNNETITFLEMDATKMSFHNKSFDVVICSHVLSTTKEPNIVLEDIYRVLKPFGILVILNHITPSNFTRYFYKAFNPVAALFCFRSDFRLENYSALGKLSLQKQTTFGFNKNYQLLTYQKLEK